MMRPILYDICRLWRMIQDHVLSGPITGIPPAFTNPKHSLLPTNSALVKTRNCPSQSHSGLQEQHFVHINLRCLINHWFYFILFVFLMIANSVSHTQRAKMTPRSVILGRQSRMTLTFHFTRMPVDYSAEWRTRETDRRREEKQK